MATLVIASAILLPALLLSAMLVGAHEFDLRLWGGLFPLLFSLLENLVN